MEELIVLEHEMEKYSICELPRELLLEAKMKGYADRQIAHLTRCWESEVHKTLGCELTAFINWYTLRLNLSANSILFNF